MRKIVAMFLMLLLMVSISAMASAASEEFEFWAQCTNASSTALDTDETAFSTKRSENDHSVYVKHWVYDGSNDYTNYFRAYIEDAEGTYYGAKWATVNLNVPIQSNSIVVGPSYGVAGRGNTNHYDYDGNYRVSLHGYLDADYGS